MDIQVLQDNLKNALAITTRFTKTKSQLPILSNILFDAKKNKLTLTATNLENSVSIDIGAKVSKPGSITLPANTISPLVNNLQASTLTIKASKERVSLSNDSFNSTILGISPSDFPSVPKTLGSNTIKLKGKDLKVAIASCIYSLSVDETRPILTGMLLVFSKSKITFVGTDGFRLSKFDLASKSKLEHSVILPKNILLELQRLITDTDDVEISLNKKESLAIFRVGDTILSSRIIQGKYPDYQKIIPGSSAVNLEIDKEELQRAIKLAGVFAKDSANTIKLSLQKSSIKINAKSSKSGEQEMSVDAKIENKSKAKLSIAFNYKFIEDVLSSVDGGVVKIDLTDANSPVVFHDPDNKNFLHLIMPVKM